MPAPYGKERQVAELAVQRAVLLTKRVLAGVDKGAQSKSDHSPVTIADFGAQALLIGAVHRNFPDDTFVGEESAGALREDEALQERVWDMVSSTRLEDAECEALLGGAMTTREDMLDVIDRGKGPGGRSGRVWMLDPVDGTKAFVGRGHYAVSLALVEDGRQEVGVVACPNLSLDLIDAGVVTDSRTDKQGLGIMLSAVRGQGGVSIRAISPAALLPSRRIEKRQFSITTAPPRLVDFPTSRGANVDISRRLASRFGSSWPPDAEVMSLQMRYAALAVGAGDISVRVPRHKAYREAVWDHAGGMLIFEEVGGKVTDLDGRPIDFGVGTSLNANYGVLAALTDVHARVSATVRELLKEIVL